MRIGRPKENRRERMQRWRKKSGGCDYLEIRGIKYSTVFKKVKFISTHPQNVCA
jgi:hypothetical protein